MALVNVQYYCVLFSSNWRMQWRLRLDQLWPQQRQWSRIPVPLQWCRTAQLVWWGGRAVWIVLLSGVRIVLEQDLRSLRLRRAPWELQRACDQCRLLSCTFKRRLHQRRPATLLQQRLVMIDSAPHLQQQQQERTTRARITRTRVRDLKGWALALWNYVSESSLNSSYHDRD